MKSYSLASISVLFFVSYGNTQSVVHDARLDNRELRCLVCKASLNEISKVVSKADSSETVKIGGHRLDAKGNYEAPKTVPITKSEVYLSEQVELICAKMDDYARALWKSNGTLTLLKMVDDEGKMNIHMSDVDFVQDDDMNKSLKYYCEGVMEEFEENIIKHLQNEDLNFIEKVCTKESKLCDEPELSEEKEEL